jgi:hypothetical protein
MRPIPAFVAALALIAAALALLRLHQAEAGLSTERVTIGDTPATIWRPVGGGPAPTVVIAHGFAGSRQLMRPFAATLARSGFLAVTFDFLGHGRNPLPLTGDVADVRGATLRLVDQLDAVARYALSLPEADGRLATLGHSMAADIIVRHALETPDVQAVVAVSMFSPAVTATEPDNLLVIVGAWEPGLTDEALRVLRLAGGAAEGETVGDPAGDFARRVAFAPSVEHVGVLYSPTSQQEARDWLAASFGLAPGDYADARGPWILLLILAVVTLGWPLSKLLPSIAAPEGAGLSGRRFWIAALGPAVATPLLLRLVDLRFLPVVVGDYLATHFALYGLLTALALWRLGARAPSRPAWGSFALAAGAVTVWALLGVGWVIDAHVSSFLPIPERFALLGSILLGALPYFLADEWLTRGPGAPRFAYPLTKLLFLLSLAAATALNLERLFFLIILAPAMLLFFVVYGLFSRWTMRATGDPFVAGAANAAVFAVAIAVTFPMIAG